IPPPATREFVAIMKQRNLIQSRSRSPRKPAGDEFHAADKEGRDDSLTVYLQEMGSIPMLNHAEERELVQQLDGVRQRYRHAALGNAWVLAQIVALFDKIHAGKGSLDRNIDVVPSRGLTSEQIRPRLGHRVGRLRRLLVKLAADFRDVQQARTVRQRM